MTPPAVTDWLDAAQTRADATASSPFTGPGWTALHDRSWAGSHVVADASGHALLVAGEGELAAADVEFAAHARQDVPRLVEAVRSVLDIADELSSQPAATAALATAARLQDAVYLALFPAPEAADAR